MLGSALPGRAKDEEENIGKPSNPGHSNHWACGVLVLQVTCPMQWVLCEATSSWCGGCTWWWG